MTRDEDRDKRPQLGSADSTVLDFVGLSWIILTCHAEARRPWASRRGHRKSMRVPLVLVEGEDSRLRNVLSTVAALVTIFTPVVGILALFRSHSTSIPSIILVLYVCFLTTSLLLLLIMQESRYHRASRYAAAMIPARKAFSSLADASWTIIEGDGSEESFLHYLRESLRFLAETYTLITDSSCRASVKMAMAFQRDNGSGHDADVQVVTLCRNEDLDSPDNSRDLISNNTDFRQIFVDNALYFLSNDLPMQLTKGYQNSHWDERLIQSGAFDYRSTIVLPIARSRFLNGQGGALRREIIGFLCIDTLATNAFNATYDVPIGQAFSQALHLALSRFRSRQLRSIDESSSSLPEREEGTHGSRP